MKESSSERQETEKWQKWSWPDSTTISIHTRQRDWQWCKNSVCMEAITGTATLCSFCKEEETQMISRFIHLVVCLTTGPKPIPKRSLHIVRSRASSFKWEYPVLSLRLSNSCLRLLPCLPVTSIPPCIFPSITRRRRQFLRKMWPIQFAFRLHISCRIFLCSLTLQILFVYGINPVMRYHIKTDIRISILV